MASSEDNEATPASRVDKVMDVDESDSDDESEDEDIPLLERLARAESSKDAGNGAFRSGDSSGAIKYYTKALDLLSKLGESDIPAEHAVRHGKLLVSLHLNSAAAHNKLEAWSAAIKSATKALEVDRSSEKASFRRGFARARCGELEGAKADLLAVLKLNPKSRDALRELASVKKRLTQSRAAERKKMSEAFKRASLTGGMYGDKEEERKAKQAKEEEAKAKRREAFNRENARREAACEPTITFEDWDKEEKAKEEKRKKEREEKQRKRDREREEAARKRRAAEEERVKLEEAELDEADLAAIKDAKGYRVRNDGTVTSYFTQERTEQEKALIGDIRPKRLETGADSSVASTAIADAGSAPAAPSGAASRRPSGSTDEAGSGSAWNRSGATWEERDVTEWAKKKLQELGVGVECSCRFACGTGASAVPLEVGNGEDAPEHMRVEFRVTAIEKLEGHASVVFSGGKCRRLYDFSLEAKWEGKVGRRGVLAEGEAPKKMKKISGVLTYPDLSFGSLHDEGALDVARSFKKAPLAEYDAVVRSALRSLETGIRKRFLEFEEALAAL